MAERRATLATAIAIADMFPPLYRRAIVEALDEKRINQYPSENLHKAFFIYAILWESTEEKYYYWSRMSLWWLFPKQYPFPDPHPSWEHRFPTEWKQYHGELPYEF